MAKKNTYIQALTEFMQNVILKKRPEKIFSGFLLHAADFCCPELDLTIMK